MIAALAVVAAAAAVPTADYRVRLDRDAKVLQVEATLPPAESWVVDDGLGLFLEDVSAEGRKGWTTLEVRRDAVTPPPCPASCRVRYRVRLREAAETLKDRGRAFLEGETILAPPSSWLLRPAPLPDKGRFRLQVSMPPGQRFVTGILPGPEPDVYEAPLDALPSAPYSAFGPLHTETIGPVEIAVPTGGTPPNPEVVRAWVDRAVAAVSGYYGRFPVPRVLVLVLPGTRRAVGFGTTMGNGGASIMVWLKPTATDAELRRDWVLAHEMTHLGFPNVPRTQHWLEEGMATYAEPIARARVGQVRPEEVWQGLVKGLPNGLPREGDRGLDFTHTWGRTYWGGALFCILADVEIRDRTGNRKGLEDALRGIQAAGGSILVDWPVSRILEVGDQAVGGTILQDLYRRMAGSPMDVDLPALWKKLGVVPGPDGVTFDDAAPAAAIRRALTAPAATPRP
jgi:hypothetical protein